jgi:hypothetical protein
MFGSTECKAPQGWIELQNEELHALYSSPNIITLIKLRRMRWVAQVARMTALLEHCPERRFSADKY